MKRFLCLLLISTVFSCFNKVEEERNDPESVLKSYIKYRFSKDQSKEDLLRRTTGQLYTDLDKFSEEDLRKIVSKYSARQGKLVINLKKCEEARCYITYTLKFDQFDGHTKAFRVEVKKIAQIDLVNEVWKIAKISDIKSHFRSYQDINVESGGEVKNPFKK